MNIKAQCDLDNLINLFVIIINLKIIYYRI